MDRLVLLQIKIQKRYENASCHRIYASVQGFPDAAARRSVKQGSNLLINHT
jgi:hypothetical protein